jgi:hypothetical protein
VLVGPKQLAQVGPTQVAVNSRGQLCWCHRPCR